MSDVVGRNYRIGDDRGIVVGWWTELTVGTVLVVDLDGRHALIPWDEVDDGCVEELDEWNSIVEK